MSPPCKNWRVWYGEEVEGLDSLGVRTLFIREMPEEVAKLPPESFTKKGTVTRVWFCHEFKNWTLLRAIAKHFSEVCIEATPSTYDTLPKDLRSSARIYLKISGITLKAGDYVCVGPAFHDEAFRIGAGAKVSPEAYLNDKKVL